MTWPMPPPVPIWPMTARITSLAVTPAGSSPSTSTAIHFGRACGSVWVASTCSTSLVPMPKASAPNAPCVAVWLSPHTIVMPGQRATLLGPDDVDDALAGVAHRVVGDAELGGVLAQHLDLAGRDRVGDRLVDVGRRDVVVLGGDRELGPADPAPGEAQPVERLRAGDLVDEVQVDVEQVGLARRRAHEVALPHLLRAASSGLTSWSSHILR